MNGFSQPHGFHGGGAAGVASQLASIADDTARAAMYAEGEYIPQLTREDELRRAFSGAGAAAAALEQSKRQLARLECGDNCLQIMGFAIVELEAGRRAIQDGVTTMANMLDQGVIVIDAVATGTAAIHLREAATIIRGIADIAKLEATPAEDLYDAIVGGR